MIDADDVVDDDAVDVDTDADGDADVMLVLMRMLTLTLMLTLMLMLMLIYLYICGAKCVLMRRKHKVLMRNTHGNNLAPIWC